MFGLCYSVLGVLQMLIVYRFTVCLVACSTGYFGVMDKGSGIVLHPQGMSSVCLFVCLFVCSKPFSAVIKLFRLKFRSHLSRKEPVLNSFPPYQTTKISPRDQTHTREITGLEVSDFNHLTTGAVCQVHKLLEH